MHQGRHYEHAFELYLKARRVSYIAIDEARTLIGTPDFTRGGARAPGLVDASVDGHSTLKDFDYIFYGSREHLLVEIKGRKVSPRHDDALDGDAGGGGGRVGGGGAATRRHRSALPRLECWTTLDDLGSLQRWEKLFGPPFSAVMVFVYWSDTYPGSALADEVFASDGRWYAVRAVRVRDYVAAMRVRSPRWRTMDLAPATFLEISGALVDSALYPLPSSRRVRPGILSPGSAGTDLGDPVELAGRVADDARRRLGFR
jgi:hypothetical protein